MLRRHWRGEPATYQVPAVVHPIVGEEAPVQATVGRETPSGGWSPGEENQRGRLVDDVAVRRYPFPYRCAFALNNDTDGFTHAPFEAFHAFVSGRGETPLGTGLGLEISDSFWFWANNKQLSLFHAGPWQDDAPPSPEHDRLLELARAGYLDTLHGFGHWNENWQLDRDRISRALDYLDSKGVKLKVYVSHGGGYHMTHNFGGPWGYYQNADNPKHKTYCLDLLTRYGFRYYWTDVLYELDKFGDDLTFENQEQLDREAGAHDTHRFFNCNDPEEYTRSRIVFPNLSAEEHIAWRRRLFNRTLVPVEARDGSTVYGFKRFRGHDGPMAGNFIVQVNSQSLEALEARQGAVVVYQHFGVWRALFAGKGHHSQRQSKPEAALDEHNVWAFRILAERYRAGRVFVTTTRRLLDFLRIRDGLEFSVDRGGERYVITIESVDCPASGRFVPEADELQGIAFVVPRDRSGDPVIMLGGRQLPATVVPDPADNGKLIVHLPWRPLEWPV